MHAKKVTGSAEDFFKVGFAPLCCLFVKFKED